MSVIVGSHDHFGEHAEFDPETRDLRPLPAKTRVRPTSVRGAFSRMLGRTLVLWNDGKGLRFVVDRREIVLTPDVTVQWGEHDGILVRRGDEELFRWEYESPALEWDRIDPTFLDDQWEDFDFGQFVANRAADVDGRVRVFDLAFDPTVVVERYFALEELAAILADAFPEAESAMLDEIWRWWWRWDTPRAQAFPTFCSFCDKERDTRIETVRGLANLVDLRLCARCRTEMSLVLEVPKAEPDRILADAVRAVLATGAPYADVLAAELARRKDLASPRTLPAGTPCSGCSAADRPLARGPGLALCARCLA